MNTVLKWVLIFTDLLVLAFLLYFFKDDFTFLGHDDPAWYDLSPFKQVVLFLIMVVGMSARYIASSIEERREKISILKKESENGEFKKPKLEFDIWEFSYPLLFSVITFGLLLSQLEDTTVTLPNLILSFQSGFFWQTIIKRKIR